MIPGVYFLVKCIKQDCSSFKKPTWIYIGMDGTYDVGQEKKYYRCGVCSSEFKSIHNILLIKCLWKYRGKQLYGDIVESLEETQVNDSYSFKQEQNIAWDWLLITVRPLITDEKLQKAEFGLQTDFTKVNEESFLRHGSTVKMIQCFLNQLDCLNKEIQTHRKRKSSQSISASTKKLKREDV